MLYLYWQVKGEEVIESLLCQRSCSRVQTFQMINFHFGPEGKILEKQYLHYKTCNKFSSEDGIMKYYLQTYCFVESKFLPDL